MSATVRAWFSEFPFPGYTDFLHSQAHEFGDRHPGVRIEIRTFGYEELPKVVGNAAYSGSGPDLASYYCGGNAIALDTVGPDEQPWFVPLETIIAGRSEVLGEPVVIDDLLPTVRQFYSGRQGIVAQPFTLTTKLMYAACQGRSLAEGGTWRDLLDSAPLFAGNGSALAAWPIDGKFVQQALTQLRSPFVAPDNGRSAQAQQLCFDSAPIKRYLTWWQELHRAGGYLHTGVAEDWSGTFAALVQGNVQVRFSSSFDSKYMVAAGAEAHNPITVHEMPAPDPRVPGGAWVGGDAMWIADGLDERTSNAAVAFTQFLARPEAMSAWHRTSGSIPVTRSAVALLESEGWYSEHPEHLAGVSQLSRTDPHPAATPAWVGDSDGIQRVLMSAITTALDADIDIGLVLPRAQLEAQALLDEYDRWRTQMDVRPPEFWRLSI